MKKVFLLVIISVLNTSAQSILKTFQSNNHSSFPRYGVDVNGSLFFTAGHPLEYGVQIWKTDGTEANTMQIKVATGSAITGPVPHFAAIDAVKPFGNKVLIIASTIQQNFDQELWVSDGTEAGTFRLADINVGSGDPNIKNLAVFTLNGNTVAFFSANNNINGQELWMTDGTQAGTYLVKDINPGVADSLPFGFTNYNNLVYFFANDGANGHEFWVSDGTLAGTNLVKDINPGSGSSALWYGTENLIISNINGLYLSVYDNNFPTNATKLYSSDGTTVNTNSMGGYQHVRNLKKFKNRIYFTMNETFTDLMCIDDLSLSLPPSFVNLSIFGSVRNAEDLTVSGDTLYFTADQGLGDRKLYLINTFISSLAYEVRDISPASSNPFPALAKDRKFIPTGNGKMYFLANDGTNGKELWFTEGSWHNTKMVRNFGSNSSDGVYSYFKMFGDKLFFIADTSSTTAECYFTQNGNTPQKMSTIDPVEGLSNFYPIQASGSYLYFSAFDPEKGYELFKTNGSSFELVKDINTNEFSFDQRFFDQGVELNNKLYFIADDGKLGKEIWSTNGKANQTKIPFEINRYPTTENLIGYSTVYYHYKTSTAIEKIAKINSKILIFEGRNIWVSDGNSLPEKIFEGNNVFNYLTRAEEMNGFIYFNNSNKLYKTNGTLAGTFLIGPPDSGNPNDNREIKILKAIDNKLFFMGHHATFGFEVFFTDGTPGNINLLADLIPGVNIFEPSGNSMVVGNKMFFSHLSATEGNILYATEGSAATTIKLKVFGFSGLEPFMFTNYNNTHLVFTADDGIHGIELWKSNGTIPGTVMVKDLHTSGSGFPRNQLYDKQFAIFNNYVFFNGNNSTTSGLFRSDLSDAGTVFISQYEGGTAKATPYGVYMSGYSLTTNSEPYKIEFDANSRRLVSDIGPGSQSSSPWNIHLLGDLVFFSTSGPMQKAEIHVFRTCPNISLKTGNQNVSSNVYGFDSVESSATLGTSTVHSYNAGKSILLQPGFKTSDQTVFETKLNGCFYSTLN
jgi:ELWxxDGT repeat protein